MAVDNGWKYEGVEVLTEYIYHIWQLQLTTAIMEAHLVLNAKMILLAKCWMVIRLSLLKGRAVVYIVYHTLRSL